ncbi:uncharacterized protein LOC110768265 [Prunus avium]|uniref:Uncharacterized protein LOC110768265 n=1 Tax=Prunus avium TaxID=42229 RepID=A0A6P5TKT0_PRUAV|nr:uncharacterized protein LOC110768265 [Prunus avium]
MFEKLVNRLRDLKIGRDFEDALHWEVDQVDSSPFTAKIKQAAPPKRFSTPSFTHFKGDFDLQSHLKHALQKCYDSLQGQRRANMQAFVFTKEYTSYWTIKKNPNHLFNLPKKHNESLRDYIKIFKIEKANIVGCDDQIASSAFKKGLPAEHNLYCELTITPSQTLVEVFATEERYTLWDDDRIAGKKSTKQAD